MIIKTLYIIENTLIHVRDKLWSKYSKSTGGSIVQWCLSEVWASYSCAHHPVFPQEPYCRRFCPRSVSHISALAVISTSFSMVTKYFLCIINSLKDFLGIGIGCIFVGVVLKGKPSVCLFDFVSGGVLLYAQDVVV